MGKELEFLVIHCAATPQGREVSGAEIRRWHTAPKPHGNGWQQVGYSDIIHLGGLVENLVPYNNDNIVDPWEITNGVQGINTRARHVVLPGGLDQEGKHPKDTRTSAQRLALANYVKQTIAQHQDIQVAGHYQFDAGKRHCPGWNVPVWLRGIGIHSHNIYQP